MNARRGPGPTGPGPQMVSGQRLQLEPQVQHVVDLDLPQGASAPAAVFEVDLLEGVSGDLLELLVAGSLLLGVEETEQCSRPVDQSREERGGRTFPNDPVMVTE